MADGESGPGAAAPRKRADARRNEAALLDAAAAAFVESGVNVPVRDIAARAGVGVGTIYRHFPARADLIVAVYRHQIEACAQAGPVLLAERGRPHHALARWIGMFVDFLVTKHGLAEALRSEAAAIHTLHAYFIDRLVPVCGQLLDAAAAAGKIRPGLDAYELHRGTARPGGDRHWRQLPGPPGKGVPLGEREPAGFRVSSDLVHLYLQPPNGRCGLRIAYPAAGRGRLPRLTPVVAFPTAPHQDLLPLYGSHQCADSVMSVGEPAGHKPDSEQRART